MHGPILIVEDDASVRESLRETLNDFGYQVAEAENGKVALEYLQAAGEPCIVLLDLMMPVMNGWELMAALLGGERKPPKVVITSAMAEAAPPNVVAVVKKPYDLTKLMRIVEQHC